MFSYKWGIYKYPAHFSRTVLILLQPEGQFFILFTADFNKPPNKQKPDLTASQTEAEEMETASWRPNNVKFMKST